MTNELNAMLKAQLSHYLPADLLNKLPERQAMREAVQRLSSLHSAVSSFLPLYIIENEEALKRDSGYLRPGTFMFADVSGFTALSEKLQAKGGAEGVEILTQIINDYFAKMLEIIAKSDGQLLKFAGDALLAFFPERSTERMDEAEKAIRTGLRMQRSMQEFFQPIQNDLLNELFGDHDLELSMSIGISRGDLFEALVGNTTQRDHIIQGPLPGMAEKAEEAGIRNDVIVDQSLCDTFEDRFNMTEMAPGFYQVIDDMGEDLGDFEFHIPRRRRASSGSLFGVLEIDPVEELEQELERVQTVACFVASEVVNKLAITAEHVTSENRPATVIFSHVSGFAEMVDAWGADELQRVVTILSRYYSIMQGIISAYGGVLTRTDPYKYGFKMLITFGAPVAHPDDPERAVLTALEIQKQLNLFNERLLDELPKEFHRKPFIQQRFGVTHGQVFAGEAGWRARREYTVMGDDVNLAARLMGKSEFGQIYVSARVWSRTAELFEYDTLEPMALKGKSNVTQAYQAIRPLRSTAEIPLTSSTPFIGRELLMMSLTSMLKRAVQQNVTGAVALVADAGTGKTRTAHQLAKAAHSFDFHVAWSSCQIHNERKTNWVTLIAQLLEFDSRQSNEEKQEIFNDAIEELGLNDMRPALADLMLDYLGGYPTNANKKNKNITDEIKLNELEDNVPSAGSGIFDLAKHDLPQLDEATRLKPPPTGLFKMLGDQLVAPAEDNTKESNGKSTTAIWEDLARKTSLEEAVISFLGAYAAQHPIMIVLDDIHDMNPYTLDVISQIIDRIADQPLVIVTTAQAGYDLPENLPQLAVSDLTEMETQLMALKLLKATELGPNLATYLWERSSGRPFYVESLIHNLQLQHQVVIEQGWAELRPDIDIQKLPDDIRELIISRVDRMSAEKQDILRLAAVLDMPFTKQITLDILARENSEVVSKDFHELLQSQMLERDDEGYYQFRHGVTQRTMYESLSRYHRQKMHQAVVNYYLEQGIEEIERNLFLIAHHMMKAGMMMRAVEMISAAAEDAEKKQDLERAIELYTRAQELLPSDDTVARQLDRLMIVRKDLKKS